MSDGVASTGDSSRSVAYVFTVGLWVFIWIIAAAYGGHVTFSVVAEWFPPIAAYIVSAAMAVVSGWGFTYGFGHMMHASLEGLATVTGGNGER